MDKELASDSVILKDSFVLAVFAGNITSNEATVTTDAYCNRTAQRDNATVWSSEDLITASLTTDERNFTTITLSQPDHLNTPFHYVTMYFNMIWIPIGLILNVLCIIVFNKFKLARTSTALEMIVLAVADNINMIANFVMSSSVWSQFSDIPDLSAMSHVTCGGTLYIGIVGALLYGLTLSVATIERFLFASLSPSRSMHGICIRRVRYCSLCL